MAISDQVKKAATSVEKFASSVTDSTKKFAEKSKLKRRVSMEESAISGNYLSIGKKVYEANGEINVSELEEFFAEIREHKAEIVKLNAQIYAIDGTAYCTNCGKAITKSDKFCSGCGAANSSYEEEAPETGAAETAEPAEKASDAVEAEVVQD
jgi:hypothetical protein